MLAARSDTHPRTGARVFMTNMSFHDYSRAKKWGDFVPLTQGRVDLIHTDRLEADLQAKLEDFNENDYLLLGGAPFVVAASVVFISLKLGYADVLYWDAMYGDYRNRRIDGQDRNKVLAQLIAGR
jgi:hypothetical protein